MKKIHLILQNSEILHYRMIMQNINTKYEMVMIKKNICNSSNALQTQLNTIGLRYINKMGFTNFQHRQLCN